MRDRDARPTVADFQHATTAAERATSKARELSAAVERQRAQLAEARSALEQSQQELADTRARLETLERDVEGRPTIAMVEELRAALEGHAARLAARDVELEAVREAADEEVTEAQEGLAKQQAFANDLAATLYDTRSSSPHSVR